MGQTNRAFNCARSMFEVPDTGEDHGHAMFVGSGNHLIVTDGAAWLDDGGDSCLCGSVDGIAEGEEGI